jgi:hypothetical protein
MQPRSVDDLPATARKPDALLLAVSLRRAARAVDALALLVRSCVRLIGAVMALAAAIVMLCVIVGTLW